MRKLSGSFQEVIVLPAHRAQIFFLERSAEASHIEAEGVTWMRHRTSVFLWLHHASSYIADVLHRSTNQRLRVAFYDEHQVWFILRCLVDREGRKRVIVFGLVDLVDREGRGSLIVFGLVYFVLLG